MSAAYFEDHPTDPNKVILRKRPCPFCQATQQRREWVGLTDEEKKDALVSVDPETRRLPPGFRDFASAIEAKLKEKNNG